MRRREFIVPAFEGERVCAPLDIAMIRSPRSQGHDRFRIVVRKKRRHIELAGLQIISAAPAVHRPGLVAASCCFTSGAEWVA
jgi:hypothetical protein